MLTGPVYACSPTHSIQSHTALTAGHHDLSPDGRENGTTRMTPPGGCRRASHDTDEGPPPRTRSSSIDRGRHPCRSVAPWTGRPSGVSSLPGRAGDTSRCAGRPYGGARPSSVWLSAILSRTPAISGASTCLKTTE